MLRGRLAIWLAAAALALALGLGVVRLFTLRIDDGDIYPPYSTLRADPLGAKAFSAALAELPGLRVERNFLPLPRLEAPEPLTLVYAGVSRQAMWEQEELASFETLVTDGSRAVFAFLPEGIATLRAEPPKKPAVPKKKKAEDGAAPEAKKAKKAKEDAAVDKKKKRAPQSDDRDEEEKARPIRFWEVAKKWGLSFEVEHAKAAGIFDAPAKRVEGLATPEPELPWHSALFFGSLQTPWHTLYEAHGRPVAIERVFGRGSIVLISDSYLLSNEALHNAARRPQFLSWLIGPHRRIVFDEEHHGLREQPGVATLLRKYRLQGFFAGLAMLAGLFLWQQSVPFLPPAGRREAGERAVAGRGAGEGLRNLLRRAVPPARLLETCLHEWRRSATARASERERVEKAFAELPAREKSPAAGYRKLVSALHREERRGARAAGSAAFTEPGATR